MCHKKVVTAYLKNLKNLKTLTEEINDGYEEKFIKVAESFPCR